MFPTELTLLENTLSDDICIRLGVDPSHGVTVTLTPTAGSAYILKVSFSPTSISFTGGDDGDWDTYKTIVVSSSANSDTLDEAFAMTPIVSGTTAILAAPDITIKIQDLGD